MRLGILQLSDIHFQPNKKFAIGRAGKIVDAINAADIAWDELLVVLGGDLAFSGKELEYKLADQFIEALRNSLTKARPEVRPSFVSVPGNHDCDYTVPEAPTRAMLLDVLSREPTKLPSTGTPLENLLAVLKQYETFHERLVGEHRSPTEQIWQHKEVGFGSETIAVNIINTTLGCQRRHDQRETDQGKLFLPSHLLQLTERTEGGPYTISILHHPLNWLESNNSVEMRHILFQHSDLILLGHQHEEDAESRETIRREKTLILRAAALQDESGSGSGFNLAVVDFDTGSEKIFEFSWSVDYYSLSSQREWARDIDPKHRSRKALLSEQARRDLADPGTGYTHPHYKKPLKLDDLYVTPKLLALFGGKNQASVDDDGPAEVLLTKSPLTVLVGESKSGKTTLARRVMSYLYDDNTDVLPILIEGDLLNESHLSAERLWRALERAIEAQYSRNYLERFAQLPKHRRSIIIDNWQTSSLNDEGKTELLRLLFTSFEHVLLIGDDSLKPDRITSYATTLSDETQFAAYKIGTFGHLLRSKLIKKWVGLGREHSISREALHSEVKRAEAILDQSLGRNFMPAYPFFVLSVLQLDDNIKTSHHANGSYGYLYESLITTALAEVSKHSTDIDVFYAALGQIAHELHSAKAKGLTSLEFTRVLERFGKESLAVLDAVDIRNKMLKAHILIYLDGQYQFKYRYIYYFFVARFFADQMRLPERLSETRSRLSELCKDIRAEDNANIIIFFIYLTRDPELIRHLIKQAEAILPSAPLFDADSQVAFLSPEVVTGHRIPLKVEHSPEENSDSERRARDEQSSDEQESIDGSHEDAEFATAMKILDILGQAVRSFPASMPGDIKVAATAEVYRLGLRLLGDIVKGLADHQDSFRSFLESAITGSEKARIKPLTEEEISRRVDQITVIFIGIIAFGIIKNITNCVGMKQLRPTYDEVKNLLSKASVSAALELIDTSINLDHGDGFPEYQVLAAHSAFRDKWFADMVLRQLVAYRFSMFHVERKIANSVGNTLGIHMNDPEVKANIASSNALGSERQRKRPKPVPRAKR